MRILSMIASLGAGGAETLVRNLSAEFVRRGHDCGVAYISDARSLNADEAFEVRFQNELAEKNIPVWIIGHDSRSNPLAGGFRLRKVIRDFKPDILHIHVGYGLLLEIFGEWKIPTVYTHHNIRRTFPAFLFRAFDWFVDQYVAICDPCARLLRRHVRRPVALIPNGVPPHFSNGTERTSLPSDILALSVGSLRPEKDHLTLIEAAARLVPIFERAGRHISFKIAGDGPQRQTIEEAIARHGLDAYVALLGVRQDISCLMERADLLVQSSMSEGLPIVMIEAAMSALPIVTTDVGGCAEIVIDGRNGYVVPARDPASLAGAIENLLFDESRYVAFSAASKRASDGFTIDRCADAHLALYRALSPTPA